MAVLVETHVPGMTSELYTGMFQQVGDQLRAAPGFLAHLAGETAAGWVVTEVWESQEAVDAFYRDTIAPMMAQAGMGMPPSQSHILHNVVLAGQQ